MHARARQVGPLVALIPVLVLLPGCDTLFGPDDDPASIDISASRTTLPLLGDTVHLAAEVRDGGGDPVEGANVAWTTGRATVAAVDGGGVVTARGNGSAWIIATSGAARDSIRIAVSSPIDCAPVGDLPLPDTLSGDLRQSDCAVEGDWYVDAWRLTIPAEMEVTLELRSTDFDALMVLLNASGTEIAFNDDNGTSFDSRITETLPAGSYYVYATTYSAGMTGSYQISAIEGVPPSPCPATAVVSFPDTVAGTVDSSSCLFNDFYIDVWRLTLDTDAVVTMNVTSGDFAPAVVVGDTLGQFIDGAGPATGSSAVLEIGLPAGSYDIWLGAASETQRSGSYTLSLTAGPTILTCAPTGTIGVPQTVTGELTGDDCFLFVSMADAWEIELADTTDIGVSLASEEFVPVILISDSLGEVRDAFFDGASSVQGETTLPPGTYRIWALADDGNLGSYTLGVSAAGELPSCEPDGALVAAGDTASAALETSDCLLPEGRYADVWTTTVDTASVLRITLSSTKFDAYLQVADSSGTRIARDDDGGGDMNAALTLELAPGLYQLWATSYLAEQLGAYELTVGPAPAGTSAGAAPALDPALDRLPGKTPFDWRRAPGASSWSGAPLHRPAKGGVIPGRPGSRQERSTR